MKIIYFLVSWRTFFSVSILKILYLLFSILKILFFSFYLENTYFSLIKILLVSNLKILTPAKVSTTAPSILPGPPWALKVSEPDVWMFMRTSWTFIMFLQTYYTFKHQKHFYLIFHLIEFILFLISLDVASLKSPQERDTTHV